MTPLPTSLSGATQQRNSPPFGAPEERGSGNRATPTTRPPTTTATGGADRDRENGKEKREQRGGGGNGSSASGDDEPPVARENAHPNYALSFTVEFENDRDTVYFSHCYPYRYTDLQVCMPSG